MGHILEFHCTNCGYDRVEDGESDCLYVGCGMMDFEVLEEKFLHGDIQTLGNLTREPHYCTSCRTIFANELGENPVVCPK